MCGFDGFSIQKKEEYFLKKKREERAEIEHKQHQRVVKNIYTISEKELSRNVGKEKLIFEEGRPHLRLERDAFLGGGRRTFISIFYPSGGSSESIRESLRREGVI